MDLQYVLENGGLDGLSAVLHENAVEKGFYDSLDMTQFNSQGKQLAMVHSEVSEVLETLRKPQKFTQADTVEEIADILIRSLDLYAALYNAGVVTDSLDESLARKAQVNSARPQMHGVLG